MSKEHASRKSEAWKSFSRIFEKRVHDNELVELKYVCVRAIAAIASTGMRRQMTMMMMIIITSLPKVIWEEGRVAALSHTCAVKSPLFTMARPKFAPKSTPSRGPIPNPHYLPHPWTPRPMMQNDIRMQSAVFLQCTAQNNAPTDRSSTGKFDHYSLGRCATTAMRPNN